MARLCENFCINELRLVSPICDTNSNEAQQMAVKGKKFLNKAKYFSCLLDAVKDCTHVIATCGRKDHGQIPLEKPSKALNWALEASEGRKIALVFGREDRGLTNKELLIAQKVISISLAEYSSLNLSHAVAIILYELHKIKTSLRNNSVKASSPNPANALELNQCLQDAESLLLEVGFLLKHTANARMTKIKSLLQRGEIRPEEVSLIRGILRQLRWALQRHNT